MKYATFREANAWEGESWNFYVPLEGNEEALARLEELTFNLKAFRVVEREVDAEEVDRRLKHRQRMMYLPLQSKMVGTLDVSPLEECEREKDVDDFLYKGGIENLFDGRKEVKPPDGVWECDV